MGGRARNHRAVIITGHTGGLVRVRRARLQMLANALIDDDLPPPAANAIAVTRDALVQSDATGQALSYLAVGQVWAAHKLCVLLKLLMKPLASHTI